MSRRMADLSRRQILQYMNVNRRVAMASACPVVYRDNRTVPARIQTLEIAEDSHTSSITIRIDEKIIKIVKLVDIVIVTVRKQDVITRTYRLRKTIRCVLEFIAHVYLNKMRVTVEKLVVHKRASLLMYCDKLTVRNFEYCSTGKWKTPWFSKIEDNQFRSVKISCEKLPTFFHDAVRNCQNVTIKYTGSMNHIHQFLDIQASRLHIDMPFRNGDVLAYCRDFLFSRRNCQMRIKLIIRKKQTAQEFPIIGPQIGAVERLHEDGRSGHQIQRGSLTYFIHQQVLHNVCTVNIETEVIKQ